jgi:hypothetical protein
MPDIEKREPLVFACGDSLVFERALRDFLPSAGWTLHYQLRGVNGEQAVPDFTSTASGDVHLIDVDGFAAAVEPGDYLLVGYAVNGAERHQIYYGELTLSANLGGNASAPDQTTHAQRMIPLLEAQLERLAQHELDDSNVQQTEFRRVKRLDLERQLGINKEIRANEIAAQNVRNGRGSGREVRTIFAIT